MSTVRDRIEHSILPRDSLPANCAVQALSKVPEQALRYSACPSCVANATRVVRVLKLLVGGRGGPRWELLSVGGTAPWWRQLSSVGGAAAPLGY